MSQILFASLLTWLRGFNAAARTQSFTKAARELNVTQGSISQQVKNLEARLGVELFTRGARQLTLTPEGEELHKAVESAYTALEKAIKSVQAPESIDNYLKINCSPSFAMLWLVPRIGRLNRVHPDINVKIHGEFHMLDHYRMQEDNTKIGIRFDPGNYTDIKATEFLDEWLIPVTTPTFYEAHKESFSTNSIPSNLMLHDACPWDSAPENTEWNHWLKHAGFTSPKRHDGPHFNLSQLALSAAFSGQGIAIGRLALIYEDLKKGLLVTPFPIAVKSQASYQYVSTTPDSESIQNIQNWLLKESHSFKEQRHCLLDSLRIEVRS